jgi:hypothetical protein
MLSLLVAELLVVLHFAFILFVVFGGLLVLRWRRMIWVHLPAATWGAMVEAMGWICPLTPWENRFRWQAGQEGYSGDFISRYLLPLIYPADLNFDLQLALAGFVVIINIIIYVFIFRKRGVE